ncbi:monovalent cation:proton antiporter-2 (CPA2) family protein [Sphingoaurantiacus capsulatus]|uniref:Monovalent cation:proton antiporter-2 (CPA2) family protein n=1 Tax=Sphingoaurantiacus capsulatus TaxID=1771310 RepID=A0ABV7X7K0_9SPHN
MATEEHAIDLLPVVALLGAATIAAPLFQRLKLGSVLGYLAAGVLIGPFGVGLLNEPAQLLRIAELGVVMFLFLIGLEMRPSRLWGLRRAIFGLGLTQALLCAAALTLVGVATGFPLAPSFVAGAGFVLTSTAIVMRLLEDRQEMVTPAGERIVSILLLEDLAIVPLLALVAFLAPIAPGNAGDEGINLTAIGIGTLSIAGLVLAGRYLLNPMFRLLTNVQGREVMTAAALLVVLGAAYAMQLGGLSMAMGAFLAGVLLSESTFRHQLEADIEPFRGILLGLFFLAVGMSLDLGVVVANWSTVLFYVFAYMAAKGVLIYAVARLFRSSHREALTRAVIMAQGGEFAFVLYSAALATGIITGEQNAILTAIVIISMVLTPIATAVLGRFIREAPSGATGEGPPEGLRASALVIGFGRVGQIASQFLLARGHAVSIIDTDIEMIDAARRFDFRVYYGDGTRLDILRAAGVEHAALVLVCVDRAEAATRIVQILKAEFPRLRVLARSSDRVHARELLAAKADFQVRETFESALRLGQKSIEMMGATPDEIAEFTTRIRQRDRQRHEVELETGDTFAGRSVFSGKADEAVIDLRRPSK